ncbi:MAG: hypothetical protein IT208_02860 [Chthonomonadales bacterium]|nr:hypothetical protein [Chthonomonadales bacterium]
MLALPVLAGALAVLASPTPSPLPRVVDPNGVRGKVMAGYQGWFRCPGDAAGMGWVHWSRDSRRISPGTLTFEMWPDMREYGPRQRYPTPGFTYPDGRQASLFSSEDAATVQRHFEWMRDHGIDGAWLQHFLVDLPGGLMPERYESRMRVLRNVRRAAARTGRVWAIAYDIAAMPEERVFDVLSADWRRLVEAGVTRDPRYLHDGGRPVVLVWGFYRNNASNHMTPRTANRLIDFFHAPGPYRAYLAGGGDWNWRRHPEPAWQAFCLRFDAYMPWNVGNYSLDAAGNQHASMQTWEEDRRLCERAGVLWVPVVYPGFSWDNLMRRPPGATLIARRRGMFLWEQLAALARQGVDSVYLAMFDEVDEGTALFKVTSDPPAQAHFVDYEGLPSDWYLRLVREGVLMLRGARPPSGAMPLRP